MGRRFPGISTLALLLTAAVAGGVFAAEPKALDMVPADSQLVVAVPSISALEAAAGAFANSVVPEAAQQITGGLNQLYTFSTGTADGLDLAAPAVLIMLSAPAPAAGDAGEAEDVGEAASLLVIPIADESAWRAAVGDKIGKEEGAAYEHLKGEWGPETYFTIREGVLVASEEAEALDIWAKALASPLAQARRAAILGGIARSPICIDVSIEAFRKAHPGFPESLLEDMPVPLAGGQGAFLKVYMGVVRDVVKDLRSAFIELAPSAAGLKVSAKVEAVEGGLFHGVFSAQQAADLAGLNNLPSDAPLFGTSRLVPDPLVGYIKSTMEDFVRAMAEGQEEADVLSAIDNLKGMIDEAIGYGVFQNTSFALAKPGESGGLNAAATYVTAQPEKVIDLFLRQQQFSRENPVALKMAAASGSPMPAPEISDETIAGVPVKVVRQTVDLEATAGAQGAQAFQAIFGEAMVSRMAAKDGRLYVTFGQDKGLMEKMLTKQGVGVDMAKVGRSLEGFAPKPSGMLLVSVPDVMLLGMSVGMAAAGGGGPLPAIQAPPTARFAAVAVSFSGGSATLELNIPSEQINAARMAMMQIMMMQMQQEGAGEPGGPDAPPWQPEAPPE